MAYNYNAYPWGRWIKWGIVALIVLIILTSTISTYNGLAKADQEVQKSWSQVENVMQSRLDKITNMVEIVKGYTKHEEKVFGDIASARSALMSNTANLQSKTDADTKLTNATRGLLVLAENYPDLKASQQFHDLQIAVEGSENRVSIERKRFIDSVNDYNMKVRAFPGSIFAKTMGFQTKNYYKASPEAAEAPKIKF